VEVQLSNEWQACYPQASSRPLDVALAERVAQHGREECCTHASMGRSAGTAASASLASEAGGLGGVWGGRERERGYRPSRDSEAVSVAVMYHIRMTKWVEAWNL